MRTTQAPTTSTLPLNFEEEVEVSTHPPSTVTISTTESKEVESNGNLDSKLDEFDFVQFLLTILLALASVFLIVFMVFTLYARWDEIYSDC